MVINDISDLQKLSFLEIKNLPLNKCKGELIENEIKRVIEIEKRAAQR